MSRMREKTKIDTAICVDITTLKELLAVGTNTARDIGEKANASFKLGNRRLYNVQKIKNYIDSLCE